MVATLPPLVHDRDFRPETGAAVRLAEGLRRITAPNAGPFTFTGTNSFLVGEGEIAVVDPGPDDGSHLEALLSAIGDAPVKALILTHTHKDHTALVRKLAAATGAPLWSGGRHRLSRRRRPFEVDPTGADSDWHLVPDRVLADGEVLEIGGLRLDVIATPGHAANHLAFGLQGTPHLLTGDHVMGWSTTLVSVPEGSMGDYLMSLGKVGALPYRVYHPGHGGPISDGPAYAQALMAHREGRNAQIVAAVAEGARNIGDLRRVIYPALSGALARAAGMTLRAHIEYLEETGRIRVLRGLFGLRLGPA